MAAGSRSEDDDEAGHYNYSSSHKKRPHTHRNGGNGNMKDDDDHGGRRPYSPVAETLFRKVIFYSSHKIAKNLYNFTRLLKPYNIFCRISSAPWSCRTTSRSPRRTTGWWPTPGNRSGNRGSKFLTTLGAYPNPMSLGCPNPLTLIIGLLCK